MKPDKTQESLHITNIKSGLAELERIAFGAKSKANFKPGLLALKIACDVFESLQQGPFPFSIAYDNPKIKECCLYVAGAMDLVRYNLAISNKSKLKRVKKHLELVGAGAFGPAATYIHQQSKPSYIQQLIRKAGFQPLRPEQLQDATRKTVELTLGLAALNTFDEVVLEDPQNSSGGVPNPDVIIQHAGRKFGIACKSLSSANRPNFRKRIDEALSQIDRAIMCGQVDKGRGIVLLDISALLDHDALYVPSTEHVWVANELPQVFMEVVNDVVGNLLSSGTSSSLQEELGGLFQKHQAAPCILFYAHAVMIASSDNSIAPHFMKAMTLRFAGDHRKVKVFTDGLNRALHCQRAKKGIR